MIRLSTDDTAVLSQISLGSERMAAVARLIATFALGIVVGSIQFLTEGSVSLDVIAAILANLGISLLCMPLARTRSRGRWAPPLAGLLDLAFVLGIVLETSHVHSVLPPGCNPAHVGTWGIILALALSAMRGSPILLLAQTLAFAGALGFAEMRPDIADIARLDITDALVTVCGPGQNAIRITVILLFGMILVVTTLRSHLSLRYAIVASRRAARLSRYMAPSVASVVADSDVADLREGRHQNVAVLFADLRDFTAMTETMPPREIAVLLTEFRRLAVVSIANEGGVVDKFIGDEVMGLFGVPAASARDAGRALRASQVLLASVRTWNERRAAASLAPVRVGIGIHYGPAFVGVLGDERLEFTVLGNTVNVARRLEELTKSLGHDCLASAWTVRSAQAESSRGWICRGLHGQQIRGQSEPVRVFAVSETKPGRTRNPATPRTGATDQATVSTGSAKV